MTCRALAEVFIDDGQNVPRTIEKLYETSSGRRGLRRRAEFDARLRRGTLKSGWLERQDLGCRRGRRRRRRQQGLHLSEHLGGGRDAGSGRRASLVGAFELYGSAGALPPPSWKRGLRRSCRSPRGSHQVMAHRVDGPRSRHQGLDQARVARVDRARYGRLPVEILISTMPWRSGVAPVTRLVSAIRVSLG